MGLSSRLIGAVQKWARTNPHSVLKFSPSCFFFLIFDRKFLIAPCCVTSILHLFVSIYVYLCIYSSIFLP